MAAGQPGHIVTLTQAGFTLWSTCQDQQEPWRALASGGCFVEDNTLGHRSDRFKRDLGDKGRVST